MSGDKIVREYTVTRRKTKTKLAPPIPHEPPPGHAWRFIHGIDDGHWEMYNVKQEQQEAREIAEMWKKVDEKSREYRIRREVEDLLG